MRNKWRLVVLMIGCVYQTYSQIIVPVPAFMKDGISSPTYDKLGKINKQLSVYTASNLASLKLIENIVSVENLRLGVIAAVQPQHTLVRKFIQSDCKKYIEKKYPIRTPFADNSFKNLAIRHRFKRKFDLSKAQVTHYFSKEVYVSEGQRILLTLMLMEDLLKITMDNEEY